MAKRKRHKPEEIVRKLHEADVMLRAGNWLAQVLQKLETTETHTIDGELSSTGWTGNKFVA